MLTLNTENLKNKKNLLAFSAGVDSSALFFLLFENNIRFDIAIVNYGTRKESDEEEVHAKALAKEHQLFCHSIKAPKFDTHFEQKAREFRYEFFESLITIEGYDTLVTAHQLNDQLEWLLMRLTKGAGLSELIGLEETSTRENYTLVRPLLSYSKEDLLSYLEENNYPFFIDESNTDNRYERNLYRQQFSDPLMAKYQEGIKRSFDYLKKDKDQLEANFEPLYVKESLRIIKLHTSASKVKAADLSLKTLGYLLSSSQRQEIENETSMVIGGNWAIEIQNDLLYIAPYMNIAMPKEFKELCRKNAIPSKIRPYMFHKKIDPKSLNTHF